MQIRCLNFLSPPEVANITFHDIRREATSRIAEHVKDAVELSMITGHKSMKMLKVYYEPNLSEIAKRLTD